MQPRSLEPTLTTLYGKTRDFFNKSRYSTTSSPRLFSIKVGAPRSSSPRLKSDFLNKSRCSTAFLPRFGRLKLRECHRGWTLRRSKWSKTPHFSFIPRYFTAFRPLVFGASKIEIENSMFLGAPRPSSPGGKPACRAIVYNNRERPPAGAITSAGDGGGLRPPPHNRSKVQPETQIELGGDRQVVRPAWRHRLKHRCHHQQRRRGLVSKMRQIE